jgi:hypothetical protein
MKQNVIGEHKTSIVGYSVRERGLEYSSDVYFENWGKLSCGSPPLHL